MSLCPEKDFIFMDSVVNPIEKIELAIKFRNLILCQDAKLLNTLADQLAESKSESFKARVIEDTNLVLEYYKPLVNTGRNYDAIISALRYRNTLLAKKLPEKYESSVKMLNFSFI